MTLTGSVWNSSSNRHPDRRIDLMHLTRRSLIGFAAIAPLAAVTRAAESAACYDPAKLPLSQRNRRRSLGYVEASTVAGKRCAGCAFFTASAQSGCGTCQLLGGGPANAGALCNSYGAKAR
jgi:hypothetical protein